MDVDGSNGGDVVTSEQDKLPFTAAAIVQLLHSMGVKEYEPRVVHQLLELFHRASHW